MWAHLRMLRSTSNLPWLVFGDFNGAMWGFEHFSKTPRMERQMADFREVLDDCDLTDLGFVSLPYTYDDGRAGSANVKVRLDRGVADTGWRERFGEATVHHLVSARSDHCPLLVEIRNEN